MRVGIGYDVHRFEAGRSLVLGGVVVPGADGLSGHSDADVLTHSLIDALFGAVAAGDIGDHFPDTDPELEGISSLELLSRTLRTVRAKGYDVVNADISLVLDAPKLGQLKVKMAETLAETLGVDSSLVSVKATTSEGLLSAEMADAAAAKAVVLLKRIGGRDPDGF
ncbi:MAG: 2-C-methyl-D-erythritol 2,4-cyclodiphosphate synthase [Terriglobia bacterium]